MQALLREQGIGWDLVDERQSGSALELAFEGRLRDDQAAAVETMLRHDIGVLQAPTAFGKTVVAAAILARRGVNTLVLVHRAELSSVNPLGRFATTKLAAGAPCSPPGCRR